MYLKIDTEVERFELVFKGFERPFTFQIIWKRILRYPFIHLGGDRRCEVFCLRKQHDGRDWASNQRPSDLKSSALTTTPPRPNKELI